STPAQFPCVRRAGRALAPAPGRETTASLLCIRRYSTRWILGLAPGIHRKLCYRKPLVLRISRGMLRRTMSDLFDSPTPQFGTAEYAGVAGTEHCSFCKQPIRGRYYRVNNAMACSGCGERAQLEEPKDSHSRYMRGLIFGVGGAIAGLI